MVRFRFICTLIRTIVDRCHQGYNRRAGYHHGRHFYSAKHGRLRYYLFCHPRNSGNIRSPPSHAGRAGVQTSKTGHARREGIHFRVFGFAVRKGARHAQHPFRCNFQHVTVNAVRTRGLFRTTMGSLFQATRVVPFPLTLLVRTERFSSEPRFVFGHFNFTHHYIGGANPLSGGNPKYS